MARDRPESNTRRRRLGVRFVFSLMAAAALARCGTTSPSGELQVAGTYQISQTALEDTCGMSSAPVSFTGTVTHTAGATTFTLIDTVGTRFTGSVDRDGNFNATATVGPDSGGQTYSERLEGRFSASGFSATLHVDMSPRNCWFTRSWTGVKQ